MNNKPNLFKYLIIGVLVIVMIFLAALFVTMEDDNQTNNQTIDQSDKAIEILQRELNRVLVDQEISKSFRDYVEADNAGLKRFRDEVEAISNHSNPALTRYINNWLTVIDSHISESDDFVEIFFTNTADYRLQIKLITDVQTDFSQSSLTSEELATAIQFLESDQTRDILAQDVITKSIDFYDYQNNRNNGYKNTIAIINENFEVNLEELMGLIPVEHIPIPTPAPRPDYTPATNYVECVPIEQGFRCTAQ